MTVDFIGPFEHHAVVVNGWSVPFLEATPINGGKIIVSLDQRFMVELTVEEADRIVPFVADCIAVALGFTAHPGQDGLDEPLRSTPMHRMHGIITTETAEGGDGGAEVG